jgi:hypothetical protein
MLQTTTVAKIMMTANTHCLQHIHTNPKPNVKPHSHTNQKPTLHLNTAHSWPNRSLHMQNHIYNNAWELYPNVSHNPAATVTTVAIFCVVHAQVDERVYL